MNKKNNSIIKVWVGDNLKNGKILESLGTCLTNNPSKAIQAYKWQTIKWNRLGYCTDVYYKYI